MWALGHCRRSLNDRLLNACVLMLEQNWSTASGGTKYCQRSAPVIVTRSTQFSAVACGRAPVVAVPISRPLLPGGFAVGWLECRVETFSCPGPTSPDLSS